MKRLSILLVVLALLPLQTQAANSFVKGIALADSSHLEDLDTIGATSYYNWTLNCRDDPRCIPMARAWQLPDSCPSVLLVGNEPNAIEPNGAPMSPADAATNVKAIQSQCPETKLIVGNVSADDWSVVGGYGSGYAWLRAFLRAYPAYNGTIGLHCYTQHSAQWCISQLGSMRRLYKGEMYVTEFGVLSQDGPQMKRLLTYIGKNFSGAWVYTNRQPASAYEQGWALQGADLITPNGLTPAGAVFAEWRP